MRPRLLALLFALFGLAVVLLLIDANRHLPLAENGESRSGTTGPIPGLDATTSGPGPAPEDWHGVMTGARYQALSCARCHWNGGLEFYRAAWSRAPAGWNLTVTPTVPDAALLSIQAAPHLGPDPPGLLLQQTPWVVGQPWTGTFQVPDQAKAINVLVTMRQGAPDPYDTLNGTGRVNGTQARQDVGTDVGPNLLGSMHAQFTSPSGAKLTAVRLEDDTLLLQVLAPESGTWTFTATVDGAAQDGQSLVEDRGAFAADPPVQVVNGALSIAFTDNPMAAMVASSSYASTLGVSVPSAATFHFQEEPDGGPPTVDLIAQAYHDHGPQLVADANDIFPYARQLVRVRGADLSLEPLPREALDAFWGTKTSYTLWSERNATRSWSYVTDGQGLMTGGGDTPYAYVDFEGRLLPGASRLRIDATWSPPIDIPDLAAKVSPANTPDWFEAKTILSKAPGKESWELAVDPAWWDITPPLRPGGAWDANIYRPLVPNTLYTGSIVLDYTVTAER